MVWDKGLQAGRQAASTKKLSICAAPQRVARYDRCSSYPPFTPTVVAISTSPSLKRGSYEMDIDERIGRAKDLIQRREEIDAELASMFGITVRAKKTLRCSNRLLKFALKGRYLTA